MTPPAPPIVMPKPATPPAITVTPPAPPVVAPPALSEPVHPYNLDSLVRERERTERDMEDMMRDMRDRLRGR
ncbi:MAG: hypothetical protein U0361_07970 [Nitrospiraceae bacterium]